MVHERLVTPEYYTGGQGGGIYNVPYSVPQIPEPCLVIPLWPWLARALRYLRIPVVGMVMLLVLAGSGFSQINNPGGSGGISSITLTDGSNTVVSSGPFTISLTGCTAGGTSSTWTITCTPGGGGGTVTSVGDLAPLFTTATRTTTPAFSLTAAAAHAVFGNNTAGSAAPTYFVPACASLSDAGAFCNGTAYGSLTGVPSTFAPTAHNLLSASHGDTTASAAVRGGGIFAIGASPTWTQVAHSAATGGYFKWNGTDVVASTGAAAGTGTCTNQFVSAENADALPTCTTATLASAQFANQGTTTTVLHGNAAGNPAFGAVVQGDVTNGYDDLTSSQTIAGVKTFKQIARYCFTDQQAGANLGAQIAACYTALPNGGTIDATNYSNASTQTFTANPWAAVTAPAPPTRVIFGPYTVQWDASSFSVSLPSFTTIEARNTTFLSTQGSSNTVGQGGFFNAMLTGAAFGSAITGSTIAASNSVTVSSATGACVGCLIGVIGANGGHANQFTTVSLDPSTTNPVDVQVASTAGWDPTTNYILIGTEILKCVSTATAPIRFTSCARGYGGTTNAAHTAGVTVNAVAFFISEITAISGTTITTVDNAVKTVSGADVAYGVRDIRFEGVGIIDGQQVRANADRQLSGIDFHLVNHGYIGQWLLRNLDHNGFTFSASRYNYVAGVTFEGNGKPAVNIGQDIDCFEQCQQNMIASTAHRDTDNALLIDDRSSGFTVYSGPSNNNTVWIGSVDGGAKGCVDIEGSSTNVIYLGKCKTTNFGIQIAGGQWTTQLVPSANVIYYTSLDNTSAAITESGFTNGFNIMLGGRIVNGPITTVSGDVYTFVDSSAGGCGSGCAGAFGASQMTGKAGEWIMQRSGGNAGFPDIIGNGAAKVIIGDSFGAGLGSAVPDWSPGATNVTSLGTAALPYTNLFLGTAATNNIKLTGTGTAARIATLPDNTGTLAELNLAQTFSALQGFTAGLQTGSSPPACTAGTAGFMCNTEGTAFTNVASAAGIFPSSTTHEYMAATNGASTATPGMMVRSQPSPVNLTGQTALKTTTTLCAAAAGACNVAGQYRISWNFWGSGTACSSVTAGSVQLQLTWTDEGANVHSVIPMPMWDQKVGTLALNFNFNTTLATEGASGSYIISTNGSVIQYATTYTACTTGTGTYNLRIAAERLQ